MAEVIAKPRSRLSRWALWIAIGAALLGIGVEGVRASLGHPLRTEAVCAALIVLVIALTQVARQRGRPR